MGTRQSHPSPSFIQGHSTIEMSEKIRGEDLSFHFIQQKIQIIDNYLKHENKTPKSNRYMLLKTLLHVYLKNNILKIQLSFG